MVGLALIGPKLVKAADPGCAAFKGTALLAYNKMIGDLNHQASQSTLTTDIQSAISQLTAAEGKAKNASAQSALSTLLSQLSTVRGDVANGSVPSTVVDQLNNAASSTDSACGTL
jgi:hypothetical protein